MKYQSLIMASMITITSASVGVIMARHDDHGRPALSTVITEQHLFDSQPAELPPCKRAAGERVDVMLVPCRWDAHKMNDVTGKSYEAYPSPLGTDTRRKLFVYDDGTVIYRD